MFYSSFKLRNQTEYCTPRGPSFSRARLVKFSINGTHIQLRLPKHNTNSPTEPLHASKAYSLEKLHLNYYLMDRPEWKGATILFRIWDFYGPWLTGSRAGVYMSLAIITPGKKNEDISFFHPRAFEGGLADYLAYCHAVERNANGEQAFLAPINWNPLTRLPCIAASFDVLENRPKNFRTGDSYRYLCLPFTDHHILCLSFHLTRASHFPEKDECRLDIDDWINIAPMKALTDDVINSLQITLSPEAQAQQAKAFSGLEDASLVKEFPPLKW